MKRFLFATILAIASVFANGESAGVLDLPTRPGVTQRVLVAVPAGRASQATLVLLMGGDGRLGIYPTRKEEVG